MTLLKSPQKTVSVETKRQIRSILLCWICYTSVYFGRISYTANIGMMESFYGVTHAEAGLVMTFFSVAYGCTQVLHGFLCRRYPRRFLVPIALFVPAVMDFIVFSGVPFGAIKYMWLISALFQSALWPMVLQVISENVGEGLMKKAVLIMSTTTAVGTLIVYGISALLAEINFKYTFLLGSVILLITSLSWLILYRRGDYLTKEKEEATRENAAQPGKKAKGFAPYLLIALLVLFALLINFGKDGLQTWVPVILKNLHGMPDGLSIVLTLVLPIFGIFGASFAVTMNGKIKNTVTLMLFFSGVIAIFETVVIFCQGSLPVMLGAFGILELLLHGACNVATTIFPLTMRHRFSSGTLTGILNGSAYLGSAASSYILGKIADVSGWTAVFVTLLGISVSTLVFGGIYWILTKKHPDLQAQEN